MKNYRKFEVVAKKQLESQGYTVIRAANKAVKTKKGFIATSFDFFNVFDLIAVKNYEVRFIQITAAKTVSAHKRKIKQKFPFVFEENDKNKITVELWWFYKSGATWHTLIFQLKHGKWHRSVPKL